MTSPADIPSDAPLVDDRRARRNVWVLVAAQAILGAQMPLHFIAGGLAGMTLAPTPLMATLPISLIVIGSMTTAPWISPFMQRFGRRSGFVLGALAGAGGALLCVAGLVWSSFVLFLLGSYATGIYMSAQGFYRFAATDTASDDFKPKAISYVMAGGLLSALIGPQLVKATSDVTLTPFLATYLAAAALNLAGMWLFFALDIPRPPRPAPGADRGRSWSELLSDPVIAVAIICAMVSYALMNLVMTSTPLAVVGCGFGVGNASDIVAAHVVAMFAPSFFTGHLIARFGTTTIVGAGLALLAAAGLAGLSGTELVNFYLALILLGLGWNFGFIGATTMLTRAHAPHERGTVQGLNDAMVFGLVSLASLSSGGLMNSADTAELGWAAVNWAMAPFLTLAGGALVWLVFARKPA
ncbi:MFS transporter [Jannaschia aquimarina]|uniref:Major Facilitator Superfamily protein n=1 Tax=Jannaschia aquimarina TaxID=935700 RepID=A0A0D1EJR3_9RHOB|nr:MFS transporter [Jannaschia aquimarina]KIT16040.1 Major Facilitator Superfamily protein [Jannaschia aquimarina]SNT00842.1 Predicted arabinose efflux permease, MFS family [Jannaschia aquimarina]